MAMSYEVHTPRDRQEETEEAVCTLAAISSRQADVLLVTSQALIHLDRRCTILEGVAAALLAAVIALFIFK